MNKGNGSGQVSGDIKVEVLNIELDDVFLACLVSLLQTAKLAKLSEGQQDALAYACGVVNTWHSGLSSAQRDAWHSGVITCIQTVRAEEEAAGD